MESKEINVATKPKHILSKVLMLLYAGWWFMFFNWFTSGKAKHPHSCGAANGALVVLTFLIVAVFSFLLLLQIVRLKAQARKYYSILLGLVLAPVLFLFLYIYFSSLLPN